MELKEGFKNMVFYSAVETIVRTTIILFSQRRWRPPIHFRGKWEGIDVENGKLWYASTNATLNMSWKQLAPLMRLAVHVYVCTHMWYVCAHTILANSREGNVINLIGGAKIPLQLPVDTSLVIALRAN